MTGVGPPRSDPFLRHQLLVVRLPSEAAARTWRKIVARAVEALLRKVPGIEIDEEMLHGAKVRLLSKDGVTIRRTMARGHLVVGTDRRAFSSALRVLTAPASGDSQGALSALPAYEAARREATGGRPGVFAFVSTARIFEVVLPHAARKDRKNLEALGLTQIQAVGIGSTVGSHGFQDAIYVHAPDAKAGLFALGKAFRAADLDRSFARTPAEAVVCAALRVRPAALYAALQELWVAALPPDQAEPSTSACVGWRRSWRP